MREEQFAKKLMDDAIKYHHLTNDPKPSIIIDKQSYKTYNFDKLKQILNSQGWNIENYEDTPDYQSGPPSRTKNKWLVYQL